MARKPRKTQLDLAIDALHADRAKLAYELTVLDATIARLEKQRGESKSKKEGE